jgi:hypothetical protein
MCHHVVPGSPSLRPPSADRMTRWCGHSGAITSIVHPSPSWHVGRLPTTLRFSRGCPPTHRCQDTPNPVHPGSTPWGRARGRVRSSHRSSPRTDQSHPRRRPSTDPHQYPDARRTRRPVALQPECRTQAHRSVATALAARPMGQPDTSLLAAADTPKAPVAFPNIDNNDHPEDMAIKSLPGNLSARRLSSRTCHLRPTPIRTQVPRPDIRRAQIGMTSSPASA